MDVGGAGTQLILTARPVEVQFQALEAYLDVAVGGIHALGTVDAHADLVQVALRERYRVAVADDCVRAAVVLISIRDLRSICKSVIFMFANLSVEAYILICAGLGWPAQL